jgi:hypothetical protein
MIMPEPAGAGLDRILAYRCTTSNDVTRIDRAPSYS